MLEKIKDIGVQVASRANDAVGGITTSVKDGVNSLASTAGTMTDTLNDKAVRASTAQMCSILEIALEELKSRPLGNRRVSLTASVNIGIAALEMQIHADPAEQPGMLALTAPVEAAALEASASEQDVERHDQSAGTQGDA